MIFEVNCIFAEKIERTPPFPSFQNNKEQQGKV